MQLLQLGHSITWRTLRTNEFFNEAGKERIIEFQTLAKTCSNVHAQISFHIYTYTYAYIAIERVFRNLIQYVLNLCEHRTFASRSTKEVV